MKKLRKIKLFFDVEKEERFFNEMNQKGWKLEYSQFGSIFTFTESAPGEYFTAIYATDKSNVIEMTSAAILSGYESIPHTIDGKGNFLYLTGRKGKVDENFISDNESRRNHHKHLRTFYGAQALTCILTALVALITLICCSPTIVKAIERWESFCQYHSGLFIALFVAAGVIAVAFLVLCVYSTLLSRLYFKSKKHHDTLNSDMKLYE